MCKKVRILISLLPEASKASIIKIEDKIRKEAKIPWCKEIKEVIIEDIEASRKKLKKHGIADNVARNIVDLYTE